MFSKWVQHLPVRTLRAVRARVRQRIGARILPEQCGAVRPQQTMALQRARRPSVSFQAGCDLSQGQGRFAAGAAGAAAVGDHLDVAARNEEVGRAGFYEAERSADVLNLARVVWGERDERRKGAVGVRLDKIGEQRRAVPHGDAVLLVKGSKASDMFRRQMASRGSKAC